MKKSKIDKQILNAYNDEERYELKTIINENSSNIENIYYEDGTLSGSD